MNRRWKKKKACQKGSGSEHLDETKSVHIATLARGFYFPAGASKHQILCSQYKEKSIRLINVNVIHCSNTFTEVIDSSLGTAWSGSKWFKLGC